VILPVQGSIYHAEQAINNILIFKKFVISVGPVFESLQPSRSSLLCQIRHTCSPNFMQPILDLINTVIDEHATYVKTPLDLRHQRTYAVKVSLVCPVADDCQGANAKTCQSNINGLLDVARKTYKEATDDFYDYVEALNGTLVPHSMTCHRDKMQGLTDSQPSMTSPPRSDTTTLANSGSDYELPTLSTA
jgi:DNA mismatch repair protein MSH4